MTPLRPASPPAISRQLAAGLPDGSIRTGERWPGNGALAGGRRAAEAVLAAAS